MDQLLTAKTKLKAFGMGADMVGVANIERWVNAPLLMSPLGLMPEGKSVIVCAIHHTDAMIEIGGENTPHELGPYSYQFFMNNLLDYISFNLARHLEDLGYKAIPITASNIWRYREYKGLKATFAPDMSHIYASVCAGLTEMGYSGIAMSPEYGPRNRFVSIITDAPLVPDPLLPGDTLCDRCGQCEKHCCADATTKEVNGTVSLEIEGHTYTFANKNLWRCAWSEHFGLDSEVKIPEVVNEEVILEKLKELGRRGGTMGCCIKYCLPRDKRSWNLDYATAPIRKKNVIPARPNPDRGIQQELLSYAFEMGADRVVIQDLNSWKEAGKDLQPLLPDGRSIAFFAMNAPAKHPSATQDNHASMVFPLSFSMQNAAFTWAQRLEKLGYSAAPNVLGGLLFEPGKTSMDHVCATAAALFGDKEPKPTVTFMITSAELMPTDVTTATTAPLPGRDLAAAVKKLALEFGADAVGITDTARLDDAIKSIRTALDHEPILNPEETGQLWLSSTVRVNETVRRLHRPEEHLSGARSVIVLAIRTPSESSECLGRRPAEAIGPNTFAQYESQNLLKLTALRLTRALSRWGFRAVAVNDLENSGSQASNPRGPQPNLFCNRISAVCAGLGTLTRGGFVNTADFGTNVRFLALVTDAELKADPLADLQELRSRCNGCDRCLTSCTVDAFKKEEAHLNVAGQILPFHPIEQKRCDWALRFGLVAAEGQTWTGSTTDVPVPDNITPEALTAAMALRDPILRIRPCVAEICAMACPYTRSQMA